MASLVSRFFQSLLQGFWRGLLRAWMLVVPLLLALTLIRMGQMAYFWPASFQVPANDIVTTLFQGFRFDLKVSAIVGALLLLILPWVSGKTNARLAAVVSFVYVMASLVNLHYFGFYKTPIDSQVLGVM